MARLIITFPTLHKVLAAEKALRTAAEMRFACRPTPTPPGLSADICGMSIELLDSAQKESALSYLQSVKLSPSGIHDVET